MCDDFLDFFTWLFLLGDGGEVACLAAESPTQSVALATGRLHIPCRVSRPGGAAGAKHVDVKGDWAGAGATVLAKAGPVVAGADVVQVEALRAGEIEDGAGTGLGGFEADGVAGAATFCSLGATSSAASALSATPTFSSGGPDFPSAAEESPSSSDSLKRPETMSDRS